MELILELTGWRMSSNEIMSSNISDLLPKKSDNPNEKVRKTSWYFDETEKALVTTTNTVFKEGNTDMVDRKHSCAPHFGRINGDVQSDLATLDFNNGEQFEDFNSRILRLQQ